MLRGARSVQARPLQAHPSFAERRGLRTLLRHRGFSGRESLAAAGAWLHGDRFDVDLVTGLAKNFAHGSIVLVGPDHLTPSQRAKLEPLSNVYITGPVPYRRIPETMAQFDICIVPHVETTFTNSLNPLK